MKRGEYSEAPVPDLIFLDVHMPMLTGLEVLREVPSARKLPICVLTGSNAERELFRKEFGIGSSNYLTKPLTRESLLACLRGHRHLQALAEDLATA